MQKNWKKGLEEILLHACYNSIILNSKKVEAPKSPLTDESIKCSVCTQSGILFGLTKEENSDTCYNTDEL